ncbi:MAG: hypothetical protein JWP97_5554 [Labilithrix sp.]|nr:hypothetical protein [Labilithrix sp.]
MAWFVNLKTAAKLVVFFVAIVVMLAITAGAGVLSARTAKDGQEATFETDLKSIAFMLTTTGQLRMMASTARDAVIQSDPAKKDAFIRDFEDQERGIQRSFDQADVVCKDEGARKMIKALAQEAVPPYLQAARDAIAASPRGSSPGTPAVVIANLEKMVKISSVGDALLVQQNARLQKQAQERAVASQVEYDQNLWRTGILFVGIVAICGLFRRVIARTIADPLRQAVEVLGRVAQGDLTVRLALDRNDEVGEVAKALNASLDAMQSTLAQVTEVSSEVSSASDELASNALAISAGAQQQAAALEETAASLEQISSTVKQNTGNAQEAAQLARSARDTAERGGDVVSAAVSAMEEITKSSAKIADIITTIDEIAFQTNLLALNAAVEAARAGEQGRGFGVVATEVRVLAQRTAAAAKEIRGLIADSSTKVKLGTDQVNESGKTLEEIVGSVKRVTDMVAEIAAASREQDAGLDQVNAAVTQVDQVTQSNAAQTEELSATATSLSDRSARLQALVAAFELRGGAAKVARTPARAPAAGAVIPIAPRRAAPRAAPAKKVANGGYEEF